MSRSQVAPAAIKMPMKVQAVTTLVLVVFGITAIILCDVWILHSGAGVQNKEWLKLIMEAGTIIVLVVIDLLIFLLFLLLPLRSLFRRLRRDRHQ